jgi:hypothetical protein
MANMGADGRDIDIEYVVSEVRYQMLADWGSSHLTVV